MAGKFRAKSITLKITPRISTYFEVRNKNPVKPPYIYRGYPHVMNLLSLGPGAGGLAAAGCFTLPCQGPASRLGTFRVISSGKMCTGGKLWKRKLVRYIYI